MTVGSGLVVLAWTAAAGSSGSMIATMSASPSARIDRPSTTFLSLMMSLVTG